MRARDAARLSAIRLLLAAVKQREVDERIELTDADVLSVIEKMLKQRRESIVQFEKAARTDLAEAEKFEVDVRERLSADAEIVSRNSRQNRPSVVRKVRMGVTVPRRSVVSLCQ